MSDLMVHTNGGPVVGVERNGVRIFRGIPFAGSTAGAGRFLPAPPAQPWTEPLDCSRFGPLAPQPVGGLEGMMGAKAPVTDEAACLTLNVWTPALDDHRRPVLVWIHGGAFITGGGATPWYDGRVLATEGDVVIVTINYRLGALGFLHLAELGGEQYATSSNVGLLDQIQALEWVRDNIAAFGGDPHDVTVFGESAGAASIGMLLGMPAARGLFHRAALQSGNASWIANRDEAADMTGHLLAELGISTDDDPVDALRAVAADELIAAQNRVTLEHGLATNVMAFRPVVDGVAIPRHPVDAVRDGDVRDIDLLIGTTLDEAALFAVADTGLNDAGPELVRARAAERLGAAGSKVIDAYLASYAPKDAWGEAATDWLFRIPAIRLAEAQHATGGRAFMYLFTWPTPVFGGILKSCHALEIPFVFGTFDRPAAQFLTGTGDDRAPISAAMRAAWLSFAKTGDPGWAAYDPIRRATRVFGPGDGVTDDPHADRRILWDGVI